MTLEQAKALEPGTILWYRPKVAGATPEAQRYALEKFPKLYEPTQVNFIKVVGWTVKVHYPAKDNGKGNYEYFHDPEELYLEKPEVSA